jgi:hypothetical protein
VPLRNSRPLKALVATGIAVSTIPLISLPAGASGVRSAEWYLSGLGVRQAWTATRGSGVLVAVLSDGVNPQQPDLTRTVRPGGDFISPSPAGQYYGETGTGIASLIAGHGYGPGGQSGIVGIAPAAKILPVTVTLPANDPKLTTAAAGIPAAIALGIRYAVAQHASVIDLPIDPGLPGSNGTGGATAAAGRSAAEQQAIDYAVAHNVVLIAPAGDNGASGDAIDYPAGYPGVIAVGAVNSGYVKPTWTSGRSYVTVTAPGANVMAATSTGFATMNSTSAASAIATGLAALIRSRFPGLSAAGVRQAMISGTILRRADGIAEGSGYGVINVERALTAANAAAPNSSLAGDLAQPDAAPSTPAAASSTLTGQIGTAGAISAGLLVLLLLCIAAYKARGRRRVVRHQEAVAAEWKGRQAQPRYPRAGTADTDRMLEYFSQPAPAGGRTGAGVSATDRPGSRASSKSGRSPVGTLRATGTRQVIEPSAAAGAARGSAGSGSAPGFGRPGLGADSRGGDPFGARVAQPPASPWDAAEPGSRSPVSPASRQVSKRPAVSGAPPWEPASQPDGEVPWGNAPEPATMPGLPAGPPPQGTEWPASLSSSLPASPAWASAPGEAEPFPGQAGPFPGHAEPFPGQAEPFPGDDVQSNSDRWPTAAAAPLPRRTPSPAGDWPTEDTPADLGDVAGIFAGRHSAAGRSDEPAPGYQPAASYQPPVPEYLPSPAQAPGGPLPVRQPRQNLPAAPVPLSPSGSLWERAVPAAETPADSGEQGTRPIYVWNPGAGDSYQDSGSGELGPKPQRWSLLADPESDSDWSS